MNIVLISVYDDLVAHGIRFLSSFIKSKGHKVKIIFLPISAHTSSSTSYATKEGRITPSVDLNLSFSKEIIREIADVCEKSDLIGISLFSSYFIKARNLTAALKKEMSSRGKPVPILWGGIHPTLKPEECLKFADMVAAGDGEQTILDVLNAIKHKKRYDGINGLYFKKQGKAIKNIPRKNIEDLDEYASQDFDIEDHYILNGSKLAQMTPKLLYQFNGDVFATMTARGCPHSCTYCGNNALRAASCGKYVRFRSTEHVISEIEKSIKKFKFFKRVAFSDDVFFIRPTEKIKEFAIEYKNRIGLPILCNISPQTVNEEKIRFMVDAGLKSVTMGIQSGSDRINIKVYKRQTPRSMILKGARILNKFAKRNELLVGYQFIIDNPYEKNSDIRDTASLLLQLPRPYTAGFYPLVFYPETVIYEAAVADNLITPGKNDVTQSYWSFKRAKGFNFATYFMLFLYFTQNIFPRKLSIFLFNLFMNDFSIFLLDHKFVTYPIYYAGSAYRFLFKKGFGKRIN